MNKLVALAGAAGVAAILASCGSAGSTPDGSAGLSVNDVRTEYVDSQGAYVSCDNVGGGMVSNQTAVATYFTITGSINSVNINLRGNTTGQYDNNYNATFSPNDLGNTGSNSYKATFYANPTINGFLPQSVHPQGIVVNPVNPGTTVYVKVVDPVGTPEGSFYSAVTVNSTTGQAFTGKSLRNIQVYAACNYVGTTTNTL